MVDHAVGRVLPGIARAAIAAHLAGDALPRVETPGGGAPQGVFVTLRERGGALRGCIGSTSPAEPSLVGETQRSAVLAATRDPRFPPVQPVELAALDIDVSVLGPPEPISRAEDLDPRRYGVIMEDVGGRRGLLLPDIEGIDDVATQLSVVRKKAGIGPDAEVRLWRFEVEKWSERGA